MAAPRYTGGLSSNSKTWNLEGIDAGFSTRFLGQFIAEGMEETVGVVLGETTTVGKEKSDFQWLRGESESFSFTSKMFASHAAINLRQQIQILKSFVKRDKALKRSPRALFTTGTEIALTVFVRQVKFLYGELRDDGTLREAVLSITLQIIDEKISKDSAAALAQQIKYSAGQIGAAAAIFSKSARGLISIPGGSLHTIGRNYPVKYGDTFESIAKIEYGNALLGDVLRRAQPEKEPLRAGDEVTLVDSTEINQIMVTQQSVFLKDRPINLSLRATKLAARNRSTIVIV